MSYYPFAGMLPANAEQAHEMRLHLMQVAAADAARLEGFRAAAAIQEERAALLELAEIRDDLARIRAAIGHPPPVVLDVKLQGTAGTVAGYASKWFEVDSYGDYTVQGCFSASLADWKAKGRMPPMLWSHDSAEPCGVWTSMVEDNTGLRVVGTLALDTKRGAEAYALLKLGAMTGLSIGFRVQPGGSTSIPKTSGRRLTELKLWEVSLVTLPAVESARLDAVKSSLHFAGDRFLASYERFLDGVGRLIETNSRTR